MATSDSQNPDNTLGLEFAEPSETPAARPDEPDEPDDSAPQPDKVQARPKPYVNPNRFETGGSKRTQMTEEELEELMKKRKEDNERIKQRMEEVEKDKNAFNERQREDQQQEQSRAEHQRKIDSARRQNARKKATDAQTREWDTGKGTDGQDDGGENPPDGAPRRRGWGRGGRGGGRGGRGRGRGGSGRGGRGGRGRDVPPASEAV